MVTFDAKKSELQSQKRHFLFKFNIGGNKSPFLAPKITNFKEKNMSQDQNLNRFENIGTKSFNLKKEMTIFVNLIN